MQQKIKIALQGLEATAASVSRFYRSGPFGARSKMRLKRTGIFATALLVFAVIALAAPVVALAETQSITQTYRGTTISYDISGLGELTEVDCCSDAQKQFQSNGKGMFRQGGPFSVSTRVIATDGNTQSSWPPYNYYPYVALIHQYCFALGCSSENSDLSMLYTDAQPGATFTATGKTDSKHRQFFSSQVLVNIANQNNDRYWFGLQIEMDSTVWDNLPWDDMTDPSRKGGPKDQPDSKFLPDGGTCKVDGFPTYAVNTATLNLVVQDTEFTVQGLCPELTTTKTWNTDPSQSGMFGNGWSFLYESTVQKHCGGAQVMAGSGKGTTYTADLCPASGTLTYPVNAVPPEGVFGTLTYMAGDYWLNLKKDTRETYRYDPVTTGSDRYRLTSITDRNGNALTTLYNPDGTISSVKDAAGRQLSFIYDSNKRAVVMGTPDGRQAIFGYDANGNLIRSVDLYGTEILYQYDAENYMSAMSYAGKTISYTYDSSGGWKHVANITDANGAVRSYSGTTGSSKTTITDARGGTTETSSSAGKTTSVLDALGNKTSMTYTNGLRTSVIDPKNNNVQMEYDSRGNQTKKTDASGKVTTYAYDASDNLVSQTNPLNETWTYAYDGRTNLTSVTSPGNKTSTMAYDAKGQLTSITDANGKSRAFTYDSFGNRASETDPLGMTTIFGYDNAGINRTTALYPNGSASNFVYDQNRRLTRITNADGTHRDFSYDGCAMTGVTDENGHSISFSRDPMLRVTGTTDAMNSLFTNSYDGNGNLVTSTNPLQKIISMVFDSADRLSKVTDPIGGSVQLSRDANGNVSAIQDERLKQTTLTFDANNRKLSTTDPLGRMVSITRDDLGRMKQQNNARGTLIGAVYDNDGRLTVKTYGAATAATYAYDKAGNLTSFSDAGSTTTYNYNGRNDVTGIVYPDGKAVTFTYDDASNMVSTNYPGGPALTYGISNRNRIDSMQWDTNSVTFSHDPVGNLLSETRSNGTNSAYQYDANNRITSIRHKKGSGTIAAMDYIRNAAGDVVTENITLPAAITLTNGSDGATYDDANQVTFFGGSAYSYDADGNLTGISGKKTFTASYDPENRLVQMTSGGVTASYRYDALGNRTEAVRGTQTTRYYHDHRGRLLFEADGSGAIVNYYLYQRGRLISLRSAGGGSSFYHYDKNGNTVAITNVSGSTVNAYSYTPYGEIAGSTETVANLFKYVGVNGVMDEGSGIYFMKNRYYDAVTGRFLQKDPIGFAAGQTSLYAYVGNNPVGRIDPSGKEGQIAGGTAGLGGASPPDYKDLPNSIDLLSLLAKIAQDQDRARDIKRWAELLNRINTTDPGFADLWTEHEKYIAKYPNLTPEESKKLGLFAIPNSSDLDIDYDLDHNDCGGGVVDYM